MSLHGRIVAWLVVFAALTVGLFVLGDQYQATRAHRALLGARADAVARQAAHDVERRYERAEARLLAFAHVPVDGFDDVAVDGFSWVRIHEGDALWSYGPEPAEARGPCPLGEVRFSVPRGAGGNGRRVTAGAPAAALLTGAGGPAAAGSGGVAAIVGPGGEVVHDPGCLLASGLLPPEANAAATAPAVAHESSLPAAGWSGVVAAGDDAARLVVVARTERPDWALVVSVDPGEFGAPFGIVGTRYLGVTLAAVLLALVGIILMIRDDMRRLHSIAQAADAIGRGQFDVWLPPPTRDDVGQLSMAVGRMANRLSTTMHQMEVTRAMAAVGELASYLSHEIRNPLSSIRMNLQMLRRDLRQGKVPEDGDELVRVCLGELQRLDDVVKTVLDVGRHTPAARDASCDAHETLQQTLKVLRPRLAAGGVAVDVRLGAVRSHVALDAKQLTSVLINLFLNAMDAMTHSAQKRILVTTELHGIEDRGAMLELRVLDSGPGVPAHVRSRIFDPFFTTKASGNGIGLATALRVMQECGGVLRCEPQAGGAGGAEFVMELPLATSARTGPGTPEPEMALAGATAAWRSSSP